MTDPRTPTSDPVAAAHDPEPLSAKDEAGLRSVIDQSMRDDYRYHARTVRMLLDTLDRDREAIRQQARAAFAAQVAGLVRAAMNELGVPGPGYPAPVANAVGYLEQIAALLAASPEPASPEAPGSGLDVERLARAITTHRVAVYQRGADTYLEHACMGDCAATIAAEYDRLAARPDASPGSGLQEAIREFGRSLPPEEPVDVRRVLTTDGLILVVGPLREFAARPDGGTDPVPDLVAGVPQREPVGDVPGQGAVTEPVPADLCGAVMATCRNEPGHDGEHWHPGLRPDGASPGSGLEELVRRAETGVAMYKLGYKLGYKEGLAAARPDGAEDAVDQAFNDPIDGWKP